MKAPGTASSAVEWGTALLPPGTGESQEGRSHASSTSQSKLVAHPVGNTRAKNTGNVAFRPCDTLISKWCTFWGEAADFLSILLLQPPPLLSLLKPFSRKTARETFI